MLGANKKKTSKRRQKRRGKHCTKACSYCRSNRTHSSTRRTQGARDQLKEVTTNQ